MTSNRSGRGKSRRNAAAPVQGKPQKKTVQSKKEQGQSQGGAGKGQLRIGIGNGNGNFDGNIKDTDRNKMEKGRGARRSSGDGQGKERGAQRSSGDVREQHALNRNRVRAERTDLPVQKKR